MSLKAIGNTGRVGLEGSLKIILFQLCHGQEHLPLIPGFLRKKHRWHKEKNPHVSTPRHIHIVPRLFLLTTFPAGKLQLSLLVGRNSYPSRVFHDPKWIRVSPGQSLGNPAPPLWRANGNSNEHTAEVIFIWRGDYYLER